MIHMFYTAVKAVPFSSFLNVAYILKHTVSLSVYINVHGKVYLFV